MKKYILTDQNGHTADDIQLSTGEYTHLRDAGKDSMAQVLASAHDSLLQAVLLGGKQTINNGKLFAINTWNLSAGAEGPMAYSRVEEIPMPDISQEQKLDFAVAALRELCNLPAIRQWARAWLSGEDRTLDSIQHLKKVLEGDLGDAEALANFERWGISGTNAEALDWANMDEETKSLVRQILRTTEHFLKTESEETESALDQAVSVLAPHAAKLDMQGIAEAASIRL